MKRILILIYFCLIAYLQAFAQAPVNDDCLNAIKINDARDYCSRANQYTNVNATPSSIGSGQDVWFKFNARNFEIKITVTGGTGAGLSSPRITFYSDCSTPLVGSTIQEGNTTIFNNAGVIPGQDYYFTVSGTGSNTGTFQVCIENYQSVLTPGQDAPGSTLICSTENIIKEVNIAGSGSDQNEARGTCLDVEPGRTNSESNSAWYRWTAGNSGTLVFTITPEKEDDIDWVLFDLGLEGNTAQPSAANAIRCAAGHGIDNSRCPTEPKYTKTGLDFNETDLSEASGCGQGQNGVVQSIVMEVGRVYALLVNNAYNGNNGFEIAFTDRAGKAGTGIFKGPTGKINYSVSNKCLPTQTFTFGTNAKDYDAIRWYFGEGASISQSSSAGNHVITYATPGLKTVVLELKNNIGCTVVETETFMVGTFPNPPIITSNKPDFCINDVIRLTTQSQPDVTYQWTGPNNFVSDLQSPEIPVTGPGVAGTYTLVVSRGGCSANAVSIIIPQIYKNPVAAFRTDPPIPNKLAYPVTIRFQNESKDADAYLWDFGDGQTSTDENPTHTYTGTGTYDITLTVFKTNVCEASIVKGSYYISPAGAIFVPNTFTPNNDAVNDELVVNMNNIRTYQIAIYNRYGVMMYSSADIVQNWDGRHKGEPAPVGTYYYVIDAVDLDNNVIKKSGSVTILR